VKKTPEELSPYRPAEYQLADVEAIQALMRGDASPAMQKRALHWIIRKLCRTYDLAYRPGGEEGRRDTDFALGCQYTGQQLVKLTLLNLAELRRRADEKQDKKK